MRFTDQQLAGIAEDIAAQVTGDLAKQVEWIQIDSTVAPQIFIDRPFEQREGPQGFDPLAWSKPKITFKFKPLAKPVEIAPWGEPGPTAWPKILGVGSFAVGLLVFLAYRGLKR
ncbi:MAG: hypothetical protein KJ648_07400 [Candidatus Omnitrophica bacterium]|nr:hypothetical protein [Candidatus Omnitrophota bacterium]